MIRNIKGGKAMSRMKRMTALLMSVLIIGSTCVPAMAVEVPVEEPAVVQEEVQQAEAAEPVEEVIEQENSAENVTSKEEEPDEKPLTEEPEIEDISNAEESAADTEKAGTGDAETEDAAAEEKPDDEAVPEKVEPDAETAAKTERALTPEEADDTGLTEPCKEAKTDTKAEKRAVDSTGTVGGTETLYKATASDASNAGEGKWEEIIETVHHKEQGHYEKVQTGTKTVVDKAAWDEQVYETVAICNACGYTSDSTEDINNHLDIHYDPELGYINASYGFTEVLRTIHHPAVTHEEDVYENVWVVDVAEWYEDVHTGRMQYVVNGQPVKDALVVIEGRPIIWTRTEALLRAGKS